jgi:hypothetical protein
VLKVLKGLICLSKKLLLPGKAQVFALILKFMCGPERLFAGQKIISPEQRALPSHHQEWSHVNLNAPVWAVRHYRKDGVGKDPSSAFAPEAAGPQVADSHAIGIVFWYDPTTNGKGYVRYFTESKKALELIESRWSDPREKENTRFERIAPGVVQVSRSFVKETTAYGFLDLVLFYLGHGVVI